MRLYGIGGCDVLCRVISRPAIALWAKVVPGPPQPSAFKQSKDDKTLSLNVPGNGFPDNHFHVELQIWQGFVIKQAQNS